MVSIRPFLAATLAATALVLAACGSGDDEPAAGGAANTADAAFPTTITHTFGTTTVDAQPKRIVTLGWNADDIVYALGDKPVATPKYTYGAEKNGTMPWSADRFDAARTTQLDTADGMPYEAIAATKPDVILAPYEGFDKETYTRLSRIAPTVAYPGKAWQTSWQDQTTMIGQALGKEQEAKQLVSDTEGKLAAAAEATPQLAGKTVSVAYFGSKVVNVYMPTDPRVQFLTELGMENSSGVESLAKSNKTGGFFADLSWERVTDIDADVVVGYVDDLTLPQLMKRPLVNDLSSVEKDSDVILSDTKVIAALSQPNVLSIPYTIDKVVPLLAKAGDNASA